METCFLNTFNSCISCSE